MTQALGERGETIAADYLRDQGYGIIARNWRCRLGEIDLVAQRHDTWVFCEVKTRRNSSMEQTLAAITAQKWQRVIHTVYAYLVAHDLNDVDCRIDAIGVVLYDQQSTLIEHIEDAIDW